MKLLTRSFVVLSAFLLTFCLAMTTAFAQHAGGCFCSQCSVNRQLGLSDGNGLRGGSTDPGLRSLSISASAGIDQTVFLDFDSGTTGTTNYTDQIRADIVDQLETIYVAFGVNFVESAPVSGDFSTLTFNAGPAGGIADAIDFRNLNQSDNATIDVSSFAGPSAAAITGLSANIAAHELGHLLGLRHRDAFGPIGSGAFAGQGGAFFPSFPGPEGAVEFEDHVLSTPGFGADPVRFEDPVWFSERSAIKLTAITQLDVAAEDAVFNDTIGSAQELVFNELIVPNTIVAGQNAGIGDFDVDAVSVTGSISDPDDVDVYSFEGEAGDLLNLEVMVFGNDNVFSTLDSQITIFDATGNPIDYFGAPAFNDDEIESFDAIILDLVLQDSGSFFVEVGNFGATTGDYELFFTRFNGVVAVPEPAAVSLLFFATAGGLSLRRRRSA